MFDAAAGGGGILTRGRKPIRMCRENEICRCNRILVVVKCARASRFTSVVCRAHFLSLSFSLSRRKKSKKKRAEREKRCIAFLDVLTHEIVRRPPIGNRLRMTKAIGRIKKGEGERGRMIRKGRRFGSYTGECSWRRRKRQSINVYPASSRSVSKY